jgi:hypothetical protein
MVNATVDNQPVSIQLDTGQSTTVPTDEVWQVQIALSANSNIGSSSVGDVSINGVEVMEFVIDANSPIGAGSPVMPSTVLVGGDTISTGGSGSVSISGFIVN